MSDFLVARDDRCPIAVADEGGDQEPCDHETTGWGWYDGGEHEPMLYQACYSHETDGAAGIADLATERDALAARLARVTTVLHEWGALNGDGDMVGAEDFAEAIQESGAWRLARDLRAALEADQDLAPLIRAREAAAWDEGFSRGFYDVLAGGDRDASESAATNPYDRQETDDD